MHGSPQVSHWARERVRRIVASELDAVDEAAIDLFSVQVTRILVAHTVVRGKNAVAQAKAMASLLEPATGAPWLLNSGERRVLRHVLIDVNQYAGTCRRHAKRAAWAARSRSIAWSDRSRVQPPETPVLAWSDRSRVQTPETPVQFRVTAFPGWLHGGGDELPAPPPQRTHLALSYPRGIQHLMQADIGSTWGQIFRDICKEFRKGRELEIFYRGAVDMNAVIPYAPEYAPLLVTVRYPSVAEIFEAGSGSRVSSRLSASRDARPASTTASSIAASRVGAADRCSAHAR
eukprot:5237988-Amphidinium_carterae.1